MADDAKSRKQAEREARLQRALRENLRRRKMQARGRSAGRDEDSAPAEPESGEDSAGRLPGG